MSSKETKKDKSERMAKHAKDRQDKERLGKEGLIKSLLYQLN